MSPLGSANRFVGYAASFSIASILYIVWFTVQDLTWGNHVSIRFDLGFAITFWLFEGTAAALLLTALPWYLAVIWHDRVKRSGLFFFAVIGAATTIVIGCATASLAPKPLFVEDQTFLEGFVIAAQRQGLCLLLTGFLFGATFWFVSERRRYPSPAPPNPSASNAPTSTAK